MGAERCIVLLVVVVMGAGLFVVNSVVDEDMVKSYSEEVARYNELHDETLLDTFMSKRSNPENNAVLPDQSDHARSSGQGINEEPEQDMGDNDRVKRSSGQGINEDPDHDMDDNDRVKRSSGQGINEDPEHDMDDNDRMKRSSGQGINEDPEHDMGDNDRVKRSSGQGINEDPEHDMDDNDRVKRSSGQGINEDPEHDMDDNDRVKRSSGQGINEDPEHDMDDNDRMKRPSGQGINEDPEHDMGDNDMVKRSSGQGINDDPEDDMDDSNRVKRSSGQGINEDPEHDMDDNDRVKRSSGQGINEDPEHDMDDNDRVKRSSGQGINEDPEHDMDDNNRVKRSSGQGINEDPEHDMDDNDRVKRSSGQGINEDPEHDMDDNNRVKRSSGQGINEDPEHDMDDSNRVKRSSGQGINEDPEHDMDDNDRVKRSSGQGINEDPEHDMDDNNRVKRSSGQGINEDPEHDMDDNNRVKRSSGQGINEDPEHDMDDNDRVKRSSGQGISEGPYDRSHFGYKLVRLLKPEIVQGVPINVKSVLKRIPEKSKPKKLSGQGIDEQNVNPSDDSSFLETASNLDFSVEDDDGEGEVDKFPMSQKAYLINNLRIPSSLEDSSDTGAVSDIDFDSEKKYAESDEFSVKGQLLDLQQHEDISSEELIPCNGEESQNGNGDEISHDDRILNPYEYHYEGENVDSDGSDDHPQIGYVLYNSVFSKNDDDRIIKLNKGIDFILGLMNTMFTGEGELTVDLPDINKRFGHGIMAGNFNATQGYFKNPASLHRTGDVAVTKSGDTVSLEVALGLRTLDAGFQHYDLKILQIHQAGTIDISVKQNSINMKISLTYGPACNLTVDYVGLDQLGGIKVDITGLGAFQSMFDMLSKWFLDNFTGDLKNTVNQKLAEKAQKAVAREDICKYFPQ